MIDDRYTPAFRLWGHIRFAGDAVEVAASIPGPGADDLKILYILYQLFGIVDSEGVSRRHRGCNKSIPGLELKGNLICTYQYIRDYRRSMECD
jgi:hypothetical protein